MKTCGHRTGATYLSLPMAMKIIKLGPNRIQFRIDGDVTDAIFASDNAKKPTLKTRFHAIYVYIYEYRCVELGGKLKFEDKIY